MELSKIIFVLSLSFALCLGDQATEETNNAVEIKFYRLQESEWKTYEMEIQFAAVVASGANQYCQSNPNSCGFFTCCTTAFKEIDIGKVAGYPENDEKDLLHKFFISIPSGSDVSNSTSLYYVLPSAVLINIIEAQRDNIHTEIGYYITWAGDRFLSLPPNKIENIVIMIVASLVLLFVIILAVALTVWNKKREDKERLQKKIEKKKFDKKERQRQKEEKKLSKEEESTEASAYNIETEVKVPTVHEEKIKRSLYGDELSRLQTTGIAGSPLKSTSQPAAKQVVSDTDSAIKMEDSRNGRDYEEASLRMGALPPLRAEAADEDAGEKKEKRRKKKKEKKHKRSKTKSVEGEENAAYGTLVDEDGKKSTEL